jgi:hypothetical protein
MLPLDFDRSAARASDPPPDAPVIPLIPLIPGIYNYCDRWCERCRFTDRCLVFRETQDEDPPRDAASLVHRVRASLQRAVERIRAIGRRERVGFTALETETEAPVEDAGRAQYELDPLVVSARQYGDLAWRLARALGPIVAARGDPAVIDAVEIIDWYSSLIGAKTFRAVSGEAFARDLRAEDAGGSDRDTAGVQADFNGSAKVALLGIAASRRAWTVLMMEGKATANGVPAQAVRMLDELDAAARLRFPLAPAFIRPGFDEAGDGPGWRES